MSVQKTIKVKTTENLVGQQFLQCLKNINGISSLSDWD